MIQLEVNDKWELLAIHKLICAVKRSDDPDLPEALFSPFIANVAEQVAAKLIDAEKNEGDLVAAENWEKCLVVNPESPLVEMFREQVESADWWSQLDLEGKQKHIWAYFSPGKPTKEVVDALIAM
ncbi:hypothetical protein MHM95_05580 [Pseudoalteromonas sp. CnMc7-15]|uniref:hypothetical protein n=1 Tax=unclassified Pseudoalteromonas TaxID=194690 RepID=UPI001EF720D3|nr:hypothetical protein [Pseudoalteromonas sp. CnMc7-15]MCG7565755.1 hypothetical protein [Pseudoalteromonas sp. CnMc7-15]